MNVSSDKQQDSDGGHKWLRRAAYAVLGLALFVAVPVTMSKWMGRSALRAQLQRLHDAGEPLTFDELLARLPAVPPSENSAIILTELEGSLASKWENRAEWKQVPFVGRAKLPPWSEPWATGRLEHIALFLTEHESTLSRLDVIHDMPRGRFDLNLTAQPVEYFLPRLRHVRTAGRIEALAALRDAAESKPNAALARCVTQVNISASLRDTPTLISAWVSLGVESLAIDTAERVLSFGENGRELLRLFRESLEGHEAHNTFLNGMRGERLLQIAMDDYLRQPVSGQTTVRPDLPGVARLSRLNWLLGGVSELNTAKSLELLGDFIDAAESPLAAIAAVREYDRRVKGLPAQYYLSKTLLPSYSRACESSAKHTASVRCARIALAAELFRLDHGRWPATLPDLVPDYIDSVPIDPFDGQPLRYKIDVDHIAIYSISLNGVDDGGDLAWPSEMRKRSPDVGFRLLNPELRGFKTIDTPDADAGQVP